MDIIDQIHCYFLHTFDMGFRMTSKEIAAVEVEEKNNESASMQKAQSVLQLKRKILTISRAQNLDSIIPNL